MIEIEQIIKPVVRAMSAYPVPTLPPNALKLDAMEAPSAFPEHLKSAWLAELEAVTINRYPPAHHAGIEALLRQRANIADDYGIIFGNGSDELIQIILLALNGGTVLAPAPSFVMYEVGAKLLGLNYVGVPLNADFSLDLKRFLEAIQTHRPKVIFLANPNNPTGTVYSHADVEAIVQNATGLVILDEAYLPYADESASHLVAKYEHLIVMRTLSKVGLAGLRFGYLYGHRAWVNELNKVRPPYNVNVLTQASIEFALKHYSELLVQTETIKSERKRFFELLKEKIEVYPSGANFLLVRVKDATAIDKALKEQNIFIKNMSHHHDLLKNCLRITISNTEENKRFLDAFLPLI